MPKKTARPVPAPDPHDTAALAFARRVLARGLGRQTSRAEDSRILRAVAKLPTPTLVRLAERIYPLLSFRLHSSREAAALGIASAWQEFCAESSGALSSLYYATNAELTDRAIGDICALMPRLVDALESGDVRDFTAARRIYHKMPRAARAYWRAWNHGNLDAPDGDVPGGDYDLEAIEFVDGAAELRAAIRLQRRRDGDT